jgi:hypothetical protein
VFETSVLLSEMNAPKESQTAVKRTSFQMICKTNIVETKSLSNEPGLKRGRNEDRLKLNENEISIKRT